MGEELSVRIEKTHVGEHSLLHVCLLGNMLYRQKVNLRELVWGSLEADTRGVIVDFGQLEMIDSSGLGALAALQTHLAHIKVNLVLAGLNPQMQTVMGSSGMKDLFIQFDTAEDATRHLTNA